MYQPKSDLLNAAEYSIGKGKNMTFEGENVSGNPRICDMGSGLYVNEADRWVLVGVISRKNHIYSTENPSQSQVFTFTNVPKYVSWIENLINPDQQLDIRSLRRFVITFVLPQN